MSIRFRQVGRFLSGVSQPGFPRSIVEFHAFDARTAAIVVKGEPGLERLRQAGAGGTVEIASDENSRVSLRADVPVPSLIVQLTPGWEVEVDGRPAGIVRVNEVMRGVVAEKGTREIVWRYRVPGLRLGAAPACWRSERSPPARPYCSDSDDARSATRRSTTEPEGSATSDMIASAAFPRDRGTRRYDDRL